MASKGANCQSTHCHKEHARVVVWNTASSANVIDAIKSSLTKLNYIFCGGIWVANRHNTKTVISFVGVGSHDDTLHLLHCTSRGTPWSGCSDRNKEWHCLNPAGSSKLNIGIYCQLCHFRKKPDKLKE